MFVVPNVKTIVSFHFAVMSHTQLVLSGQLVPVADGQGGDRIVPDIPGLVGPDESSALHFEVPATSVTTAAHLVASPYTFEITHKNCKINSTFEVRTRVGM